MNFFDEPQSAKGSNTPPSSPPQPLPTETKTLPKSILRSPPHIECDYDLNPSKLYKLIEAKDWTASILRTRSNPEEAQTWVKRTEKDGKLRWKLLPLHAALILRSPGDVVAALIKVYTQGAQCKDDQGMLPLHLAFQKEAPEDAVEVLLRVYPEAVKVKDKRAKTPLERTRVNVQPTSVMNAYSHACVHAERASIIEEQERIYDIKFQTMRETHDKEMEALKQRMQSEIDELGHVRNEALHSARELSLYDLSSTHNVIGVLKDEIECLKQTVSDLTKVNVSYKTALEDMKSKRDDLSQALIRMAFEQDAIVKAAQQQKEGMDAATMVREKMMQAISQQETESRLKAELERKAIMDLATQQKKVIQNVVARTAGGTIPDETDGDNKSESSGMKFQL